MSHEERDAKILEVFKEMFKSYDVNDDGTIKTSELVEVREQLHGTTMSSFSLWLSWMSTPSVRYFVMAGFKIFDQVHHQYSIINN